ncbi:MAG: short-chain fatty acid transporter [Dethiobacter sp.]|nr:short-chain fatty acid transporter [Dethiobacter sp.]
MDSVQVKDNVLRRVSRSLTVSIDKYLPDAFIFALLLSFLVFLMGIFIAKETPFKMINHWHNGFWNFLAFSMQMVLIVITGHCIASTKLVSGWIERIAKSAKDAKGAVVITVVVSAIAGWLNWGLGLVVGALVAKQMAKQQENIDFPALVAAAYSGAMCGIFGMSITAPLLVNTAGHFLEKQIGLIPVTQTILNPIILVSVVILTIVTAIAFRFMVPLRKEEIHLVDKSLLEDKAAEQAVTQKSFAATLENSWIISTIVGIAGLILVVHHFVTKGMDLNINIVNFTLLILGIILHKNPINYVNAVANAVRSVCGIILQFPFYAGIMGMMSGSGLVLIIVNWIVSIATPASFPFLSFVSVAFVNIFIPSAGGQWMVQGPILTEAGQALGVPHYITVNAFTFGDISTNLIQPFWALPVLGIAGLKMKDIWGYCFISFLIYFIVASLSLIYQVNIL